MARYLDEAQATAAGFTIVHEPEASRFALYRDAGSHDAEHHELVGEASYSVFPNRDDSTPGIIDFNHTVVRGDLRGTGLAALLARRALTDDVVRGHRVAASCWFIAGYLKRHPELLGAVT